MSILFLSIFLVQQQGLVSNHNQSQVTKIGWSHLKLYNLHLDLAIFDLLF